jgi:hypothetical protein
VPAPQNYANHPHRPYAWQAAWVGAVVATGLLISSAYNAFSAQSLALALLGISVVLAITLLRLFALRLQNRIIRVEMQLRLARAGRERDLAKLTVPQLVALRFASDAELPALLDRALAEQLSADQIKRAVQDWQADLGRV